jgi:hypothetical protein
MRFFDEKDFLTYQGFLYKTIQETIESMTDKDKSIKAVLIGEFPDGKSRFITVHPFSNATHIHHPEYDHFGSLVTDMIPPGMNMVIIEVNHDHAFSRTTKSD